MQLVPVNDTSTDGKLTSIASAVQNVCNATLSLLFTGSLFVWGLLVNRKQAWRTDGGTAAFGVGALLLAIASTTITFVYIPSKDQYNWMPGLMWSVILWQSFLGWWWWVGAGMSVAVGEVDELLRREEKRRKKRKAKIEAKKVRKEKAHTFWKGVAGVLGVYRPPDSSSSTEGEGGPRLASSPRVRSSASSSARIKRFDTKTTVSSFSSSSSPPSTPPDSVLDRIKVLAKYGYEWYLYLRHAHLMASRVQAEENVGKIHQVYGKEGADVGDPPSDVGWGLGSFGMRQAKDTESGLEREQGFQRILDQRKSEAEEWVDEPEDDEGTTTDGFERGPVEGSSKRRTFKVARTSGPDVGMSKTSPSSSIQESRRSSMWYWGPLQRWRLRDTTTYT